MRFWLLMACWEVIEQSLTPCWYSDSPVRASAITSGLGSGEERFRGFGSMLKKERAATGMAQAGLAGA